MSVRSAPCPSSWVENGQGPAPAGQLAGDGGVGHDRAFLAGVETDPTLVQTVVGLLAAVARGRIGRVLTAAQIGADPVGWAMMPGSLDQQPAGRDRCRSW